MRRQTDVGDRTAVDAQLALLVGESRELYGRGRAIDRAGCQQPADTATDLPRKAQVRGRVERVVREHFSIVAAEPRPALARTERRDGPATH